MLQSEFKGDDMRQISTVIASIIALLPDPAAVTDPTLSSGVVALKGELNSLLRKAQYCSPEDQTMWPSLTGLLYKYLPPASATSGNAWAYQISQLVLNAPAGGK
jgi:hypothetical protein